MKIIEESIIVTCTTAGKPSTVRWRGTEHPVHSIADYWCVRSYWWSRDIHRRYLRLITTGGVMDVYVDVTGGGWTLYRIPD